MHVCKNNMPPVQLVVAQRPQTGHPLILLTFNHLLLAPKVSFQALALALCHGSLALGSSASWPGLIEKDAVAGFRALRCSLVLRQIEHGEEASAQAEAHKPPVGSLTRIRYQLSSKFSPGCIPKIVF